MIQRVTPRGEERGAIGAAFRRTSCSPRAFPSDDPTFADLLVRFGIDSISVDPDSILKVRERVHAAEALQGAA